MTASPPLLWDLFCRVIDNHGDLGVCWRLARQLCARGERVRLWVDDAQALTWMAPGALQGNAPDAPGVQVHPWDKAACATTLATLPPAHVWVEAFGCELPPAFVAARVAQGLPPPAWINLEYLSAENWVPRMHALPSPVLHGPASGWHKWFFYPGFTPDTGGLLRESDMPARQHAFNARAWLRQQNIAPPSSAPAGALRISLFCYEPPALASLLSQLHHAPNPSHLLVTAGRAHAAVQRIMMEKKCRASTPSNNSSLQISYLNFLPQTAYDKLLWACDLNFVRGEDSLVRALWAGQPLIWHIYPQPEDNAHHAKLHAFLDWLQAPPSLREFHLLWNHLRSGPLPAIDYALLAEWRHCVQAARQRLLQQPDLCTQLQQFARAKSPAPTLAQHTPSGQQG